VPVPVGVVAVIVVELVTFTPVAGLVPILTVAPLTKPVPVMVIEVPPANGPPLGETDDTTGLGAARTGRARKREEPITRIIKNNNERNFLFISTPFLKFLKLNY
jgi:hypothetical protein